MKVFVSGHRGYVGAQLIPLLLEKGYEVTGCDSVLYAGCQWSPEVSPHKDLIKDIREVTEEDLSGHDCVIHLAALTNPSGKDISPDWLYSVNRDASIRLCLLAKSVGVRRFLFASTCEVYGSQRKGVVSETVPAYPCSAYAESKWQAERAILAMGRGKFAPTVFRFGYAYGLSPSLRVDLGINAWLVEAMVKEEVDYDPHTSSTYPFVHCKDMARVLMESLEADASTLAQKTINVASDLYSKAQVLQAVKALVPDVRMRTGPSSEGAMIPCNACGERLSSLLPHFVFTYTLEHGIKDLVDGLCARGFSKSDYEGDQFVRARSGDWERLACAACASQ